ncbi:hypothetical protein DM558_07810 [Entomomonas moraniae]|uniref:Uncharacterized protein n=1 Tax=Entomomonas moraniae TaxID=2213226 RepID=A0A3S9XEB8_9GAMM|nr:hypothetical protein [Entomomonas moraniae]AZS50690.1 hypothetical protein DM558_07810 [Entomomonas moraniae]
MIKATDFIFEKTLFFVKQDEYGRAFSSKSLNDACHSLALKLVNEFGNYKDFSLFEPERVARASKIAQRFEREFLRENKKPKFIILHGTDIKEMDILTWNTGCDAPYYENAVFESKEEAKRFAEVEEMDDFTIVEVSNEN